MNKTPREILLERHRAAGGRLDAIRERVLVQELTATDAGAAPGSQDIATTLARLPLRVWTELFWRCRRIWGGLAAAWLVIIVVNVQSLEEPSATQSGSGGASPAFWTFVVEQNRLLTELGDVAPTPPAQQPPPAPRPRSDRCEFNRVRC
jgi:hypothetical protein